MSGFTSVFAIATITGLWFHAPMVANMDGLAQEDDGIAQNYGNEEQAPSMPDVEDVLSSADLDELEYADSLSEVEAADEPVTREEFSANLGALVMGMKQRMANQIDRTP